MLSLFGKLHVKGGDGFLEFMASEKSVFALKKNFFCFICLCYTFGDFSDGGN